MRPARLPQAARSERAGSQSLRAWSQESVYWGSMRKKEGKGGGGEIYHKKSVKSAEFLHEKGGISIWPQLPSEATEASNENEFKTQSDVFLDGVRGTEQQPPPRASPPTPPSPAAPQPRWAPPRSVRSPQRGPPLPSRSSQSGGQTHRSIRSTQWRTSKQEAKSALSRRGEFRGREWRGQEEGEWGGGWSSEDVAGMCPAFPRPWGWARPLGRAGGAGCWLGDQTPLLCNNSGRLLPLPLEGSTHGRLGWKHGSSWEKSVSLSGPKGPVSSFMDS